jgi:hypothetical protein
MKRRWFQIHLSTAVALMVLASVLLWANIKPHETAFGVPTTDSTGQLYGYADYFTYWRGWPKPAHFESHGFQTTGLIVDSVIALFAMLIITVVLEVRIRRREARKP